MQSPMGSPMGSSLILDERTTPMMELSPPGMHDPCSELFKMTEFKNHVCIHLKKVSITAFCARQFKLRTRQLDIDAHGYPVITMSVYVELDDYQILHAQAKAGSLPNLQHGMTPHQQPPSFYHQTIGQRHSTGGALVGAPRLAPSTRTPESQSAPTSPANNLDPSQQLQWHGTR
ncbi:hypothetical protein TELCIR_01428 [Teladorsagia circumcincta]|uniref:Uncharacterized protein n=1 Tax=Teladorsagia circumcincta TaxID=45464 RepID=A0A2G9V3H5_TELCI|nr:hypothetical protein TELCIR_01428 [Teladorsagia circumcincta]